MVAKGGFNMPSLTIKNVPPKLYQRLKESARDHRRSINSEVIFYLERAFTSRRVDPEQFISRLEDLQQHISAPALTDKMLREAKDKGRP